MTPTLDPSILERLRAEMAGSDIDLVGEMIEAFLADAPGMIDGLKTAAGGADSEVLRRQVHKLKGSGASVGALRLAELCHEVETRAMGRDLPGCRVLVPEVEGELARASDALRALR